MTEKMLWWDDGIDFRPRTDSEMQNMLSQQRTSLLKIQQLNDYVQQDYKKIETMTKNLKMLFFHPIKYVLLILRIKVNAQEINRLSCSVVGK